MAGSFASALLDELMGRNRDANPNDKRRDVHWSDPEICKYFICGICPHDLFTNTRADLGACTKLHDESIKREYQQSSRCERMGYEDDLLKYLNTVISEADKRIVRGQQRLLMAATEHTMPPTPEQLEVDIKVEAIKKEISDLVAEAESLGNEGKVEEAQQKSAKCDELRVERLKLQEMRDKMLRPYEEVYKRRPMEVCEICGAMLFIDDAPQRLDDHIQGKQHVGYARIRAYIAERQKKREETEKKGENDGKEEEKSADADGSDEKSNATNVNNALPPHPAGNEVVQNDPRRDSRSAERRRADHESRQEHGEHRNRDVSSSERRKSERDREHRRDGEQRSHDRESHHRDREDRHGSDRHRASDNGRERRRSRDRERSRDRDSRRRDDHHDRGHDHRRNSDSTVRRSERSRSRSRRDPKSHSSRNEASADRHRSRDRSHGRSRSRRDRSRSRH